MTNSRSIDSPRTLQPRKSSLKPPKSSLSEQLNNNNNYTSHENGAFNSTELEVVDEINEVIEDKIEEKIEKKPIQEPRRKSIVTFSEKTEVNYGWLHSSSITWIRTLFFGSVFRVLTHLTQKLISVQFIDSLKRLVFCKYI